MSAAEPCPSLAWSRFKECGGYVARLAESWMLVKPKYHMRNFMDIVDGLVTMYHGGRNLESDYREVKSHKKGRWEHGPGLYLTDHLDRAVQYSKGGGKIYQVSFLPDVAKRIDNVIIPLEDMIAFVNRYALTKLRPTIVSDLRANMTRVGTDGVAAEVLVNLLLNWEAIPNSKTGILRQFLINHGVDYGQTRYGGRDETVVVVINPHIIKKVEIVKSDR